MFPKYSNNLCAVLADKRIARGWFPFSRGRSTQGDGELSLHSDPPKFSPIPRSNSPNTTLSTT